MPNISRSFVLPDLVSILPFSFSSNPHYKQAAAQSAAWIDSFKVFKDRKRVDFIQSCTELLVSYGYPSASFEEFRTCCDFMNIIFLLDELCDEQDEGDARKTGDTFLQALRDEEEDLTVTSPVYTIVRQFRARFIKRASVGCQRRLWKLSESYLNSLREEAENRDLGRLLDLESYVALRRDVSAARICYGLFEYVHGIDLPEEVFEDETFMRLYWAGIDMIGLSNDLYSYKMEYRKGLDGSNIVTVLMREKGLTLQDAVDYVGADFKALLDDFLAQETSLPSFGPIVDDGVRRYVHSIKQSIIGYIIWCFDTYRYFGPEDRAVQHTLVVNLTSSHSSDESSGFDKGFQSDVSVSV